MKLSINLLQETQRIKGRLRRMGLAIQSASVVVLIVFGVFIFLLFSYTLVLGRKQDNLSKSIAEQKTVIERMRPVEAKQVIIHQKLGLAGKVVGEPSLPYGLVSELYDLSQGHNLKESKAQGVRGETVIQLQAKADDVFSLVSFLDALSDFAKERGAIRLTGSNFARTAEGTYRLQILFEIEEGS